ncbi:uncharacterized protein LOC134819089 isoform X1 [Bolinopsis microptera]|uniref:uncharacterized protein LOC134819089 isoform X1 n=1 Tax=Bolinopsis microptera TaxID=2820187 RepID=UPI00307A871E
MGSSTRKDAGSSLRANNSDDRIDEMSGLYSALHDFQCNQQHCLSFKKDQIVEVTKASSSANWHRGRIHGKAGFLPANGYLVKVDLDSCARVVVRQDFEGATSGQLKIYEGQVVSVIAKNDVQWWTVRSDSGKWGQVPAKFLKIMNGSTEGEVTVHTPIESPDIVISRDMPPLSRTQSHQTPLVKADISSIPRASTIDRTSGNKLFDDDVTKQSCDVTTNQADLTSTDCCEAAAGGYDSTDYAVQFSELPFDQQQTIVCEALNKLSAQELSQFVREDYSLVYLLNPEQSPNKSGKLVERPEPVILYDSIRQSTPHKTRRSKPSSRYRSRKQQRSIRAARYDFKTGKIVDVSLTSSVGSTETSTQLDSYTCTNSLSAAQNMSVLHEGDHDDNVFYEGADTTYQEVQRHRRAPTDAHQFFRTVFASPISKRVDREPKFKVAETSTTDLTFTCSSCSCVKCPDGGIYSTGLTGPTGNSGRSVEVEVIKNLPVYQEISKSVGLSSEQLSVFNPFELSKSPYSRPLKARRSQLPATQTSGIKPGSEKANNSFGGSTQTALIIDSSKENIPPSKGILHDTEAFNRQVDQFLNELDDIRFSKMFLDDEDNLLIPSSGDRKDLVPASPDQIRARLFQIDRTLDRKGGGSKGPSLMQKGKKAECVRISSSLVEGVRRNGVKYQTSKNIVQTVLERLSEEYPDWDEKLAGLCRALNQEADLQSNSVDSLKLEQLFEQLIALTEDDQQRGWSCKDDTEEISTMLTDLLGLLTNANPKVVIQVLQSVKYEPLLTLVEYYQLETRKPLKKQALQVLHESMLIQPDPICSILLTSRLPVQLASDIQANKVMSLLEQQCNVFCACLSYPNAMPRNHYDQLDEVFISYLMTAIEAEESPYDPENLIPVMFLKCVLSLNLHYTDLRNNKVCNVLKSRAHATVLSETLLVSFNRAENLTGYFPESKDGVRKIMLDLFSSPDTGELFFTNDVKVLIEVLHRNVIDRGEGDPDRVYYMQLLDRVISNTEYEDHSHYKYEILQVLQQVQDEESTDKESKSEAWKILKKHAILST